MIKHVPDSASITPTSTHPSARATAAEVTFYRHGRRRSCVHCGGRAVLASGRALGLARDEGLTKLLFEPGTRRLLGAGIVGVNAGDLVAETVHALEMGANVEDIALTIHPHPTLSETVAFAAEMAAGTITDLMPKRPARR